MGVNRSKFRSLASDNMDRWKSKGGKSQRRVSEKEQDQRRERGSLKREENDKQVSP